MVTTASPPPPAPALYALPIPDRPPKTWFQTLNAALFIVAFNLGAFMIHAVQLAILLPLWLLPFPWAAALYKDVARYCKGCCGALLVLMTQLFAPTTLSVTFEREGLGAFTEEQLAQIVVRDARGKVVSLDFPPQAVLISNHQVYADWWYAWCFTYFMGTHKDVFIVLKKSLKWVPFLGWAMQFFDFIFLARSWASDRHELATHLSTLAKSSSSSSSSSTPAHPLTLLLYPEGTLVSQHTRPVSASYAAAIGVPDLTNTLLPRSTGLHYSLRALAPRIPALRLIDLTVVYPGVPARGYGQAYYTLKSIFFDRVPPPVIHVHVRMFEVAREVPIGGVAGYGAAAGGRGDRDSVSEVDFPAEERVVFDKWVRALWGEKDAGIVRFLETGSLGATADATRVGIPVVLRRKREVLDAFCLFVPGVVGVVWGRVKHLL